MVGTYQFSEKGLKEFISNSLLELAHIGIGLAAATLNNCGYFAIGDKVSVVKDGHLLKVYSSEAGGSEIEHATEKAFYAKAGV